ncbi:UxaA family hydrolase [Agrilactobacillus yilanensis]|uniref:UxaA family hydrolase n=1 Tax=Agrilactobacillus yilanensis TaxID=2485997 RepID=A0ABW4J796_9LACO|nr:UxaA family hydrolase [Agrilactobacillus yilanensis]
MEKHVVKMRDEDNVAIALHDIAKGTRIEGGITVNDNIPQAHKVALVDVPKGGSIFRYGVVLGYAKEDIHPGDWINEDSLILPKSPELHELEYGTNVDAKLPEPTRTTFMGYDVPGSEYAGTRNILGIHTTVQCVVGILNVAVEQMKKELLPKYPHVDDIVVISHGYGCGVAIDAREAYIPIREIRNITKNPNFGGQLMVVGLGCEKLTPDRIMDPEDINDDNFLSFQDHHGFKAIMAALFEMAEKKLKVLDQRRRTELPLSKLSVGFQCGGSDAFSGVTANPAAGYASDMLVSAGGTTMFSEVTEVRDGVPFIANRVLDKPNCDKLAKEMSWYDDYLKDGGVDRSANPTPGNRAGGLSTIVEKSMGSIAKSGTAPISQVVSAGEIPTKHGLIFDATPAGDFTCGPMQLASGMGLEVFVTGRGTPYNLEAAPVIKVCSRTDLKEMWQDLIDINAGTIATGEKTIAEVGREIFEKIVAVASGEKPVAEDLGLFNDIVIFNPAPMT